MQKHVIKPALALMVVVALMLGSPHAQSAVASEKPAKAKTTASKKTAKAAGAGQRRTVKFMPGSQESTQERSMRLKRECQGGVNAGACEGYTR